MGLPGVLYLTAANANEPSKADMLDREIVNSKSVNSKWFDLQGRRVLQPGKGIYIRNGLKVVIK